MQKGAQVSTIDVTENINFERLYLVSGQRNIAPFFTMPSAPTSPPLALHLFLDFCPSGPSFFCQHDSPSNLAESLYPQRWWWNFWKNEISMSKFRFLPQIFWKSLRYSGAQLIPDSCQKDWSDRQKGTDRKADWQMDWLTNRWKDEKSQTSFFSLKLWWAGSKSNTIRPFSPSHWNVTHWWYICCNINLKFQAEECKGHKFLIFRRPYTG